ncbi:MAG: sigma-54-dependent Fis family transcriptional regulator [Bacteroidetes bacterium]|nr:sigma-54-dependent Fis family transcriptional regulator [Bacteroidota bacterium]
MKRDIHILIIDDEENMRHMLKAMLERQGYKITTAGDGSEALQIIDTEYFEFILCDIRMPVLDGIAFLEKSQKRLNDTTVIMMSAYGSIDMAIKAMNMGAYDFISKPFKTDEVLLTLKKAEERETLKDENRHLKTQLKSVQDYVGFVDIVGNSQSMEEIIKLAEKVAPYDTTILITGESGVGKELIARGIHASSPRGNRSFFAINCGSIPLELLESELFGYMKGAFTGADRDKKGMFEEANGSTLFLDEIGELPVVMQVKLLRVLQENEIRPIGANVGKKIDVRILAATARDLEKEVQEKSFRQDLFYRLNVMPLKLPPLRERVVDIPLLCTHFINKYNRRFSTHIQRVSKAAMTRLIHYDWPGNIRELENVIQRGVVLTENNTIDEAHLPASIGEKKKTFIDSTFDNIFSIKHAQKILEEKMIRKALNETAGNKSKAAQLLEMSYPSLLNKIKEYSIVFGNIDNN